MKKFFAWWECAQGTGRPETPRVVNGVVAPWVKNAELLPWADGSAFIVGEFSDEDGAWDMLNGMVERDADGFTQWRNGVQL